MKITRGQAVSAGVPEPIAFQPYKYTLNPFDVQVTSTPEQRARGEYTITIAGPAHAMRPGLEDLARQRRCKHCGHSSRLHTVGFTGVAQDGAHCQVRAAGGPFIYEDETETDCQCPGFQP